MNGSDRLQVCLLFEPSFQAIYLQQSWPLEAGGQQLITGYVTHVEEESLEADTGVETILNGAYVPRTARYC